MSKLLCPVGCKYCMASRITIRSKHWVDNSKKIGMNKSCVFFNRLPSDPPLKDMNLPFNLLHGEYLGFQGITDCMWDVYYEDLKWLVNHLEDFGVRKLVLTTKMPISNKHLELFSHNPRILVVYSLTGLDTLENTTTEERLHSINLLRENGVDVLPIIHPYIHGYSNLSFLEDLKRMGIKHISWKGFRYNPTTMAELEKYIPSRILDKYAGHDENEVLQGAAYLTELTKSFDLEYIDLKDYIQTHKAGVGSPVAYTIAQQEVNDLAEQVVFSSSEQDKQKIIDYCIKRRTIIKY